MNWWNIHKGRKRIFQKPKHIKVQTSLIWTAPVPVIGVLVKRLSSLTSSQGPGHQATLLVGWELTESMYIMSSILGGLVTHTKSIQFQIFIDKYLNNEKLMNRIFEYIQFWKIYESNIRIYSDISKLRIEYSNIFIWSKSIFVLEYWIFGEQYSNIRIYSNIRPSLIWGF